MSNSTVGSVYQQIIRDVVESSRVDFEEGGVEESVLEELSRGWQSKLSQLGVAQFPWDPKPEPAPVSMTHTPVPSSSMNYQQSVETPPMSQPQSSLSLPSLPPMQQLPQMNNTNGGPRIKAEPGSENGAAQAPPAYNMPTGTTAQQRAAQNLQNTFGARAAASITAIHGVPQQQAQQQNQQNMQQNMQQQQQQQRPAGQQIPRPAMTQAQYQQAMAQQAAAQRQQIQSQGGINGAQTDGADEFEEESIGVMKRVNSQGQEVEMGRIEIDHMIRRKIEAMGQTMEGGGLMMPLRERKAASQKGKSKMRKTANGPVPNVDTVMSNLPSSSLVPSQMDGGDDDDDDDDDKLKDEDADEDAINSDLDDPDDGLNEDEDDEDGMGHIMLCMYDKVQRVKNKWKCVMKDGVLTVNGKEYVFHKASGEYEW